MKREEKVNQIRLDYERKLNQDLEKAFSDLEGLLGSSYSDDTAKLKVILEKIVEIYQNIKTQHFKYDKEDYKYYNDRLEKLIKSEKYKALEESHKNSDEYQSWEDYKDEEKIVERKENRGEEDEER